MANMQIIPAAGGNVAAQHVEMMVPLYSYGCEKKVKKALSHFRGIHSVDVDYSLQKVTVWGICDKEAVLATIRKKRREARFWDQKDQNDVKAAVPEREIEVEEAPRRAKVTNYRLKKLYKKLIPLILYLN